MRPSPPTHFQVTDFGWWRGGVAAVSALAAVALAVWTWQGSGGPLTLLAAALGTAAIVAALSAVRLQQPVRLRWDAGHWYVGAASSGEGEVPDVPRRLHVAVDIGPWMLLRLVPAEGHSCAGTAWIPVQRSGHEAMWHEIRRAVYFPRPSVGSPPGAESHLPE